jgi:ligand-binding SRPBCC domain-containing protein
MPACQFAFSSRLAAAPETVWAHAMSIRGVNRELFPLARMTCPRDLGRDLTHLPLGRRAFRSWILAAGLVPIDYDDLTFVELEPGRRFLERSSMMSQREWCHERTVEPAECGSILTDRVRFVPRLPALGAVFLPVFRLSFRLRHWNLRRLFGSGR